MSDWSSPPAAANLVVWCDEMGASSWPSNLWSQTGNAIAPAPVAGISGYQWTLAGGQRVELRSLLAPTLLSSEGSTSRIVGRISAASTQKLRLGLVDGQADSFTTVPSNGAWIEHDGAGSAQLVVATAGVLRTDALAIALPLDGWFEWGIECRTLPGSMSEIIAFAAGVPVAIVGDVTPPAGWLWPRVAATGAGALALDRLGRATAGPTTGEYLS